MNYITDLIFFDEEGNTLRKLIFGTLFMAFVFTLVFHWKTVKAAFREKDTFRT
jgi:hypothetical protein